MRQKLIFYYCQNNLKSINFSDYYFSTLFI
jgi:hypothetical protein